MKYLLSKIASVCGGRLTGADREVVRVVTDSRSFSGGGSGGKAGQSGGVMFVALRGATRDGADYAGEMYARGVRAFMVRQALDEKAFPEASCVVVDDTLEALQRLAAHHRSGFRGKVVGITGSHGKTIVKEWIAQLTPKGVSLYRSPKSWNSQIGVPLALLMASGNEDYVVIEAGISEPGEMATLAKMIRPDIGILTTVGGAHEQNFGSREELEAEKMVLFERCGDVLRGTNEGELAVRNAELAVRFWSHEGHKVTREAIEALEPVAMRLEVKEGLGGSVIINDTYSSDVNSLGPAIDYLTSVAAGRPRMVITSKDDAAEEVVRAAGVEQYVGIGPDMTVDDFLLQMEEAALNGKAILIKGGARRGLDRLSSALERKTHTTVMEVDLDAILENLKLCRTRLTAGVGVMPMIKAGAYGHGAREVARTLESAGTDYLAVAFADEGVALRKVGIAMPIVVLNADEGSFETMIRHKLEPEIYNPVSLGEFSTLLKRHGEHDYPLHLKLDTGMHRLGFREDQIAELVSTLAAAEKWARVATIFSHLAAADDPVHDEFTRKQIEDFDRMSKAVAKTLPYPVKRHIANTAGMERFPEAQFDIVRLGLGLYGIGMDGARQAATLKTRIVNVMELEAGETVGYGRCGVLGRPSVVATIPIGYADGLDRHLSCGKWSVRVAGKEAPIVGRVCMDSCMVDVTGIEGVKEGDEVVIFSPAEGNTIADMAAARGTIPYEVMTGISERVKRIYTKE